MNESTLRTLMTHWKFLKERAVKQGDRDLAAKCAAWIDSLERQAR